MTKEGVNFIPLLLRETWFRVSSLQRKKDPTGTDIIVRISINLEPFIFVVRPRQAGSPK